MNVKFVQAKTTTLQAPVTSTEVAEIALTRLVDIYGNVLSLADFGDIIYLTLDPGTDQEEIISATGFTVNDDGSASLDTGIVRGLQAKSPYTAGGTASAHSAGATAIVSNNPQLYASLVSLTGDQTISDVKTFTLPPKSSSDPISNDDLARKSWVEGLVLGTLTTIDVIVPGTAGATLVAGNLVYFDTGTGTWKLANAGTAATVNEVLLGIAQGAGTSGNPITSGVLLQGVDANQTGLTQGSVYYASNVDGGISTTPGTTTVAVGIAKTATSLYFSPRFDQQLTQNQLDAMAGTSGTAPSGTNKFVDAADVSSAAASGKIVRANGTALPALDGSALLNIFASSLAKNFTAGMTIAAGKPVCLLPFPLADIGYDTSVASAASNVTSTSFSFTVATNSNRMLLVAVYADHTSSASISGITYNGASMSVSASQGSLGSANNAMYLFYLAAPATGSNTLVITAGASATNITYAVYSYYNCAQQAPEAHTVATGGSGVTSATVTPLTNGAMVFGVTDAGGGFGGSGGAAFTNHATSQQVLSTGDSGNNYPPAPVIGSRNQSGSGGESNCAVIVASIAPVAAGATPRAYLTSTLQAATSDAFTGIAQASVTVGQSLSTLLYGVDANQSGLTPSTKYFLGDTPGAFVTSAGTVSRKAGISLSATQMLITNIW